MRNSELQFLLYTGTHNATQTSSMFLRRSNYHLSWDTVVDELISRNHLLLDTLLAYTVPLQKQHSGTIFEQLPAVLGMVYATIIKCRWKKLSLIQHVISLTLVEEKVHQKTWFILLNTK
ncbi:hypothetical protein V1264_007362 [Littorina saxatilis]|uniref:Uncharacterized protein n=1 Tax=Littorina saxatilis TaxID=31220 RepID=A0AAN9AUU6_9CAEN